jgi:hypothetical protein
MVIRRTPAMLRGDRSRFALAPPTRRSGPPSSPELFHCGGTPFCITNLQRVPIHLNLASASWRSIALTDGDARAGQNGRRGAGLVPLPHLRGMSLLFHVQRALMPHSEERWVFWG